MSFLLNSISGWTFDRAPGFRQSVVAHGARGISPTPMQLAHFCAYITSPGGTMKLPELAALHPLHNFSRSGAFTPTLRRSRSIVKILGEPVSAFRMAPLLAPLDYQVKIYRMPSSTLSNPASCSTPLAPKSWRTPSLG